LRAPGFAASGFFGSRAFSIAVNAGAQSQRITLAASPGLRSFRKLVNFVGSERIVPPSHRPARRERQVISRAHWRMRFISWSCQTCSAISGYAALKMPYGRLGVRLVFRREFALQSLKMMADITQVDFELLLMFLGVNGRLRRLLGIGSAS